MSTVKTVETRGILRGSTNTTPTSRLQKSQFFQDHPETYVPLHKSSVARTSDENKLLFKAMRGIRAFKSLSDFTLNQLCACLKYQEFVPNRAIFKQGDQGSAWFILLTGVVSVHVTKTGRIQDSFQVATMKEGDGFGDLALVNDQPRAATILTMTYCETVSVEKVTSPAAPLQPKWITRHCFYTKYRRTIIESSNSFTQQR